MSTRPPVTTKPRRKPATLGIVTAGRIAGVGRSVSYESARTGQLIPGVPVIKVGQRYRVPTAPLEAELGIDILDHLTDAELGIEDDQPLAS
jgi:hypothetical protein